MDDKFYNQIKNIFLPKKTAINKIKLIKRMK